ncbi:dockerin type I repeat-containing protein [Candidatus Saccharibacteria bacterium]|nr:dockerin type I repeat-containing protein [Candidatus Saccharibacteria bacterium]
MPFENINNTSFRKKRLLSGLIVIGAVATVLALTAADSHRIARAASTNAAKSAALDKYGKHFEIQYYWGPSGQQITANPSNIASIIANSGFTIAPFRDSYDSQWTADSNSSAASILDSYNLKTYIFHGNNAELGRQSGISTVKSFYDTYLKPNMDFKNVIGYDITDEPAKHSITGVSVGLDITTPAVANFYSVDPMRDTYVNLFPNYAPVDCLEYKSASGCDAQGNLDLTAYEDYLSLFLDSSAVRTLSVDYYPKAKDSLNVTYNDYTDRDLYYANLRSLLYHYKAKRNQNIEAVPMNIVALHDWYVDANSKSQVMYQVSNNLAFGMKRLSYFTYMHPSTGTSWDSGWLVNSDAVTKSSFYNIVSDINSWAFNLGNELYSKEVDEIYQVRGSMKPLIYQDTNTVHNVRFLGNVSAKSNGNDAEAILTSFDDATFMIANGEPNSVVSFYFDGIALSNMEYFDAYNNVWQNISDGIQYDLASFNTSANTVILPVGSNVLLHLASGVSAKNTGVMIDKEGKRIVSYSSDLNNVADNITSTTKTQNGTTITLQDGTYNILYPSSSAGCVVRPAFVFTGFNTSFSECGFSTNSNLLSFTKLDDNYVALKYNSNGQQVKNLPIISASTSNYTVSGTTIKTNGASFDTSRIIVTNGVGEQSGLTYNIYTWPLKILVASFTIDTSEPEPEPDPEPEPQLEITDLTGGGATINIVSDNSFTVMSELACKVLVSTDNGTTWTLVDPSTAVGTNHRGYTLNETSGAVIVLAYAGDANTDSSVNVRDARKVINSIIGGDTLSGLEQKLADVDRSGGVNVRDARRIITSIIGETSISW